MTPAGQGWGWRCSAWGRGYQPGQGVELFSRKGSWLRRRRGTSPWLLRGELESMEGSST